MGVIRKCVWMAATVVIVLLLLRNGSVRAFPAAAVNPPTDHPPVDTGIIEGEADERRRHTWNHRPIDQFFTVTTARAIQPSANSTDNGLPEVPFRKAPAVIRPFFLGAEFQNAMRPSKSDFIAEGESFNSGARIGAQRSFSNFPTLLNQPDKHDGYADSIDRRTIWPERIISTSPNYKNLPKPSTESKETMTTTTTTTTTAVTSSSPSSVKSIDDEKDPPIVLTTRLNDTTIGTAFGLSEDHTDDLFSMRIVEVPTTSTSTRSKNVVKVTPSSIVRVGAAAKIVATNDVDEPTTAAANVSATTSAHSPVTTVFSPVTSTSTVSPVTSTLSPVPSSLSPVTSTLSPVTSTFSSVATSFSPVTITLSPVKSTLSPVTTSFSPSTSAISHKTTIFSPLTTAISPTTVLVQTTITPTMQPPNAPSIELPVTSAETVKSTVTATTWAMSSTQPSTLQTATETTTTTTASSENVHVKTEQTPKRRVPNFLSNPRKTYRSRPSTLPTTTTTTTTEPTELAATSQSQDSRSSTREPKYVPTLPPPPPPTSPRRQHVITVPPIDDGGFVILDDDEYDDRATSHDHVDGLIPEGANEAIMVSCAIGISAVVFFAAVFFFCMLRNRRTVYRAPESTPSVDNSASPFHTKLG